MIKDAWNTLGWRIKQEVEEQFGEPDVFMVRRDMVDDAIGYRAASVTDIWSGVSRWSETSQEHVRQALEMVGPGAFAWLRKAENLVGDAVSYAKTMIIIRSVAVGGRQHPVEHSAPVILHADRQGTAVIWSTPQFVA